MTSVNLTNSVGPIFWGEYLSIETIPENDGSYFFAFRVPRLCCNYIVRVLIPRIGSRPFDAASISDSLTGVAISQGFYYFRKFGDDTIGIKLMVRSRIIDRLQ